MPFPGLFIDYKRKGKLFLPIFSPYFVVKSVAKYLKIGEQISKLCLKINLNREFAWEREIILNCGSFQNFLLDSVVIAPGKS